MKRIFATIVCVIAIVLYTFFSCRYIGTFSAEIKAEIINFQNENHSSENIEKIKYCFENRKNVLLFIANKEHIDELETAVTKLEYAVVYSNLQDIDSYKQLIINTVDEIKRTSHTLF